MTPPSSRGAQRIGARNIRTIPARSSCRRQPRRPPWRRLAPPIAMPPSGSPEVIALLLPLIGTTAGGGPRGAGRIPRGRAGGGAPSAGHGSTSTIRQPSAPDRPTRRRWRRARKRWRDRCSRRNWRAWWPRSRCLCRRWRSMRSAAIPRPHSCSSSRSTRSRKPARRPGASPQDGHVRGIALFPRSTWGDRLYEAFTAELRATGVELAAAQFYDPGARDFSAPLRAALGRFGGAGDRTAKGEPVRRDAAAEARDGPQFAFIAAVGADGTGDPPAVAIPDGVRPARLRDLRCLGPGRAFSARPRRPDVSGDALDPARGPRRPGTLAGAARRRRPRARAAGSASMRSDSMPTSCCAA